MAPRGLSSPADVEEDQSEPCLTRCESGEDSLLAGLSHDHVATLALYQHLIDLTDLQLVARTSAERQQLRSDGTNPIGVETMG